LHVDGERTRETKPRVENGYIYPLHGPGLGSRLQPDIVKRKGVTVHRTDLA